MQGGRLVVIPSYSRSRGGMCRKGDCLRSNIRSRGTIRYEEGNFSSNENLPR